MAANSFGIATNTASVMINEVCNAAMLFAEPKYLHLSKINHDIKEKNFRFQNQF